MGAAAQPPPQQDKSGETDDSMGLRGAPVPGKQWNGNDDEEEEEDTEKQVASDPKKTKDAAGAGLLSGVFGEKHQREDVLGNEEPVEPAAKSARTSLSSLFAALPTPKT